jgi:hypothetical protein
MRPFKKYPNYEQLLKAFEYWGVEGPVTDSFLDNVMQIRTRGKLKNAIFSSERKGIRETETIFGNHIA